MIEFQVTVTVEGGLHARPAALLVSRASRSQSKITLNKGDKTVDARSILGIMTLGVSQGDQLLIQIDGSDEEDAAAQIQDLFHQEFAG
ncbi:HPr family phosphocarrier protein [Brevibacillus brevis]|uniref:Phosphocarrier protein HPr n=1 Tax=Brevibacillus brevis TaxID=1393 RepID=A0ABY9T4D9_BREBE|nr:HPr family phosphocarrier protein [Brevibacillus brevis]WNC14891.1 HPr family phosphocarrier protein [Brevibacillus brevis]